MSEIRVNQWIDEGGTKAPTATYGVEVPVGYGITGAGGVNVSGVATVGGVGAIVVSGITTVSDATESSSTTSGALVISGGVGIAKSLNVGGNVTVGGTLTYEDVTNQDVLGLSTFRNGLNVGSTQGSGTGVAVTFTNAGNAYFGRTGIVTATQFVGILTGTADVTVGVGTTATTFRTVDGGTQNNFGGVMKEECAIIGNNLTTVGVDLAKGNVHYYTSNGSGGTTAAITYQGGNNVSSWMAIGDNVSVSIITKPNNSEYVNAVTIDGGAVTEEWSGGTTPSSASGAASSWTITTINITKIAATGTPNSDYLVLCQATNYA